MAGFGLYQGTQGIPYNVGKQGFPEVQTQGVGGGINMGDKDMSPGAASAPGSYGSSAYLSGLPQWLQDYFDANLAGQGGESLSAAQGLYGNIYPELIKQYGLGVAQNPYFTSKGDAEKGFDPFNNNYFQTDITQRPNSTIYAKSQRNPFTGELIGGYNTTTVGGGGGASPESMPWSGKNVGMGMAINPILGQGMAAQNFLEKGKFW